MLRDQPRGVCLVGVHAQDAGDQSLDRVAGVLRMRGRERARTRLHGLEHGHDLSAPDLADDDPVEVEPQKVLEEVIEGDRARTTAVDAEFARTGSCFAGRWVAAVVLAREGRSRTRSRASPPTPRDPARPRAHALKVVFPEPCAPETTIDFRARTAARRNCSRTGSMVADSRMDPSDTRGMRCLRMRTTGRCETSMIAASRARFPRLRWSTGFALENERSPPPSGPRGTPGTPQAPHRSPRPVARPRGVRRCTAGAPGRGP